MIGDGEYRAYFEEQKRKHKQKISDDEKTILKNINKRWKTIGRKLGGALYLGEQHGIDSTFEDFFGEMFEWVEFGEEYKIEELLKE